MARTFAVLIAGAVVAITLGAFATARKSDSLYFDAPVDAPVHSASVETGVG